MLLLQVFVVGATTKVGGYKECWLNFNISQYQKYLYRFWFVHEIYSTYKSIGIAKTNLRMTTVGNLLHSRHICFRRVFFSIFVFALFSLLFTVRKINNKYSFQVQ